MVLRHLDFLDHILVGEKPTRFNQYNNRLYIDMDWKNDISVGEYLIIECYRKLDPETMTCPKYINSMNIIEKVELPASKARKKEQSEVKPKETEKHSKY